MNAMPPGNAADRRQQYIEHRRAGLNQWEATQAVGVSLPTGRKYERWFELAEGRQPEPALVRDGRRPASISAVVSARSGRQR